MRTKHLADSELWFDYLVDRNISPIVASLIGVRVSEDEQFLCFPRGNDAWKLRKWGGGFLNYPNGVSQSDCIPLKYVWDGDVDGVLVCEGESDTLRVSTDVLEEDLPWNVLCSPGATSFPNNWIEYFEGEVIVFPDNDDAGRLLADKVCGLWPSAKVFFPESDMCEELNGGRSLIHCINNANIYTPREPLKRPHFDWDNNAASSTHNASERSTALLNLVRMHVQLRPSGEELVGKCPFHQDDTASFYVNLKKGVFHCFGCNKSGDAVNYYMNKNNVGYREAIMKVYNDK